MSGTLLSLAQSPVARREFPVAPEPMIPAGVASMGMPGSSVAPLDTVDPTARMMLRAGIGQTVPETSRLYQLATDAATNFAGTTPMRGGLLPIYRGESSANKGGNFWSVDREFARNFTQSGRDNEILARFIHPDEVFRPSAPVYAGDEAAVARAIEEARVAGKRAVTLQEGRGGGEPESLFVLDRAALQRGGR